MSAPKRSGDIPFIVFTGMEDIDTKTRKLIRSHVMLGKNQRTKTPHTKRRTYIASHEGSTNLTGPLISKTYCSSIPNRVGSDLSFVQFADNIEPSMVGDIIKFSSVSKTIMFPLEACIFFNKKHGVWFDPLTSDPVYLHAMAFGTQAFFSWASGGKSFPTGKGASLHFGKTLGLLRERLLLDDEKAKLTNQTISVILTLAIHARVAGEHETAKNHLVGLRKIVNLRGGIASFKENPSLLIEIFRCDIGFTLHSGEQPFFFGEPFLGSFMAYPCVPSFQEDMPEFLANIDEQLKGPWKAMKSFCSLVNLVSEAKGGITPENLLEAMNSVMYRLLDMSFETGSVNETIRLGLLAFALNVFLQWRNVRQFYPYFYTTYKNCLLELTALDGLSPRFVLWLLTTGSISIFTDMDVAWLNPWLRANLELNEVNSWGGMRDILNSFMWIGLIHDKPGKAVFDSVTLSHQLLEEGK